MTELRKLKNQNSIPNNVIAELNDMAYKAIKKGSLNKLVDQRAIKNENLYQKLEQKALELSSKLNTDELEAMHKVVIQEIGDCPLSCMNTLEAMQEADCMCIGLRVQRPEAAIADASRLVIKDIYPTYITAESFL